MWGTDAVEASTHEGSVPVVGVGLDGSRGRDEALAVREAQREITALVISRKRVEAGRFLGRMHQRFGAPACAVVRLLLSRTRGHRRCPRQGQAPRLHVACAVT